MDLEFGFGQPRRIKSFYFKKIDGEDGPINIMTHNNQFIVPRQSNSKSDVSVVLYNKRIYNISRKSKLKEVVIEENIPKLRDYQIEEIRSLSDEGRGVKGYLISNKDREIVIV